MEPRFELKESGLPSLSLLTALVYHTQNIHIDAWTVGVWVLQTLKGHTKLLEGTVKTVKDII